MEIRIDTQPREWYDQYMKKSNNKVSQHKIKRSVKNKKRIQAKPYLSKFEQQQNRIREEIVLGSLRSVPNQNWRYCGRSGRSRQNIKRTKALHY